MHEDRHGGNVWKFFTGDTEEEKADRWGAEKDVGLNEEDEEVDLCLATPM